MNLSRYIGIPYVDNGRSEAGCDCYGLVKLVFENEVGIELASHSNGYDGREDHDAISDLVHLETKTWIEVDEPRMFDVVLLRSAYESGEGYHVGVAVCPDRMLHTTLNKSACIEKFTSYLWRNKVVGFFRHADL